MLLMQVWDDHYMRPITLVPDGQVTIKGVKMLRYLIDNSTWELNPFYFQTIEGNSFLITPHTATNSTATNRICKYVWSVFWSPCFP